MYRPKECGGFAFLVRQKIDVKDNHFALKFQTAMDFRGEV